MKKGVWNVCITFTFVLLIIVIGLGTSEVNDFNTGDNNGCYSADIPYVSESHPLYKDSRFGKGETEYASEQGIYLWTDEKIPVVCKSENDFSVLNYQGNPPIITESPGGRYTFHSYSEMTTELQTIASSYPDIVHMYELGTSVQGRSIWGLKITDNPDVEENEPEVRIAGLHHGNELMSAELPLLLAWDLVENYTSDPYTAKLVNTTEIWIIPMVNPDGREANPATRYNANGVDLNRDYGYMWVGAGNSPEPFSQPETQAIRTHALENNFVLSLSFHTSGDIVNYVWNYKPNPTPDDAVISYLCTNYGSHNGYWVVLGYNWYQTRGDTNDFSYGCRGDIDTTIEVQNSDIAEAWNLNRNATIEMIDAADIGVSGVVTDAQTGEPLTATIWVEEAYWPCFSDPQVGDYHRILFPGNYTLHFQANGYEEKIFFVEVTDIEQPVFLNVTLSPQDNFFAYQVCWCNYYDPYSYPNNFQNNPTEAISSLGPPDNISASIGVGGEIVLDMGEAAIIYNGPGVDFTIFEGDSLPEGYLVYASTTWNGPWVQVGVGSGTSSFNLADANMTHAQFIKIDDDGDGSPYDDNPGFDLDAIQVHNTFDIYTDGIDVSAWQGTIDWVAVYNSGYQFAYAKATEGVGWTDPKFYDNMNNGSAAGMLMGAYHYATPEIDDAIDEAEYFLEMARDFISQGYLRPVLDLEQGSDLGSEQLSSWVHDWMTTIENETGVQPVIYVNSNYANNYLDSSVNQYDLWIAHWTYDPYTPPDIGIWDHWGFWQYSNQGSVPGITGDVDLDVFNGNLSDLNDFVIQNQQFSYQLYDGWNMVTIPFNGSWTAETLGENISSSSLIVKFDASTQTFITHVMGTPYDNFAIEVGRGYFIYVTSPSVFTMNGIALPSVTVPIFPQWNTIGWFKETPTSAESLGENISGCTIVTMFDATIPAFLTHIVGAPHENFLIDRGMGLFIYSTETTLWHGEG